MSPRLRTLTVLCLASAAWAFSFGLGAPLAALWLRDAGCGAGVVGLNTATYYLGAALAALWAPWLMKKAGPWCIAGGILVDALTTTLFPWAPGLAGWFLLRLLGGAASAACFIPMETLVNHNAAPDKRARDFGLYAGCVALGVGLGALVGLPLYAWAPRIAFLIGGLAALPAVCLARWGLPRGIVRRGAWGMGREEPVSEHSAPGPAAHPMPHAPRLTAFGAAWAQGFLEGGMVTFLSIHLLGLGYTEAEVGWLMGVLFLGVVLFQAPSAWLADRFGRLRILLACHGLLLVGLGCMSFCTGPLAVGGLLFVLGGSCAALYPLGLALLGERTPPAALARANAWYLTSNCAGSLSGPVLMGAAIDLFGTQRAMFGVGMAAVALVLGVGAAWRVGGRTAGENARSGEPAPPRKMAG